MGRLNDLIYEAQAARQGKGSLSDAMVHYADTETALPASGREDVLYAVRTDTANQGHPMLYYYKNGVYEKTGGGSGSDPALTARIAAIENELTTSVSNFTEDFAVQNKIDKDKSDTVNGTGYVRSTKLAAFKEDYSSSAYFDAPNSTGVNLDTINKKMMLRPAATSGIAVSTALATMGTTKATLDADVLNKSIMSFSEYTKISQTNSTSYHRAPYSVIDRTGRLWRFWYIDAVGLMMQVWDSEGNVLKAATLISSGSTNMAIDATHIKAVVDYNNVVWILVGAKSATNGTTRALLAFNPDFTAFIAPAQWLGNTSSSSVNALVDILVDRNNRIWHFAGSYDGASLNSVFIACRNPDGSQFLGTTSISGLGNGMNATQLEAVYDPVRDRIVVFATNSTTTLLKFTVSLTGTISAATAVTGLATIAYNRFKATYDAHNDKFVVFLPATSGGALRMVYIDPVSLAVTSYLDVGVTGVNNSGFDLAVKDGTYYVSYVSTKDNGATGSVHVVGLKFNGSIDMNDTRVDNDTTTYKAKPRVFFDLGGSLHVTYETARYGYSVIEDANYVNTPTTVSFFLSNDNGLTWIAAPLGQGITFPASGNKVRVRTQFTSPITNFSSEVSGYRLTEGNDTTNTDTTRTFYSSTLPSVQPASKFALTVTQTLNGGLIDWYVTNNGGRDWIAVTDFGGRYSFVDPFGPDVRVKAVLHFPITGTASPIIYGYSLQVTNQVVGSDLAVLQQNLLKTNFKVAALTNVGKYGLKNMVVDDYNDTSGVNTALTTAGYDSMNKLFKLGINMLAGTTGGYTVSPAFGSSYVDTNPVSRLTNGVIGNIANTSDGSWMGWNIGAGTVAKVVFDLGSAKQWSSMDVLVGSATNAGIYYPTNFVIEGSTDNVIWYAINSKAPALTNYANAGADLGQSTVNMPFAGANYYRYIRLSLTAGAGSWIFISEVRLFSATNTGVIISTSDAVGFVPTKILLSAEYSNGATGSVVFQISRDGGTTWAAIAPDNLTDLSAQPSGSSLVSKVILTDDATITSLGYSWG